MIFSLNAAAPHPDLLPNFEFLPVVINDPVHDLFFVSSTTYTGAIIIITAYQFARTGYRHGLVFANKQTRGELVQFDTKIGKTLPQPPPFRKGRGPGGGFILISLLRPSVSRSGKCG
jgi:hypothetical protein